MADEKWMMKKRMVETTKFVPLSNIEEPDRRPYRKIEPFSQTGTPTPSIPEVEAHPMQKSGLKGAMNADGHFEIDHKK